MRPVCCFTPKIKQAGMQFWVTEATFGGCHQLHSNVDVEMAEFVHSCEYSSPISATVEFLSLCQDGTNTAMCSGIVLKNKNT